MSVQRIRTIKPEFFVHEGLADVTMPARLLFVGLWTVADRDGRLEDRPRRLKAQLFPHDAVNIDLLLEELAGRGFIRRYVVEGHECIDIPAFLKHQRVGNREPASEIPACTGVLKHASAGSSSRAPAGTGTGTGIGTGKGTGRSRSLRSLDATGGGDAGGFDQFWDAYPRKEKKRAAWNAWTTLAPTPDVVARILTALTWQRDNPRWREQSGRYVPHPASYLLARRWEDEPPTLKLFSTSPKTSANMAAIKAGLGLEHDRR